jgi:hypothetical protein
MFRVTLFVFQVAVKEANLSWTCETRRSRHRCR